jgi:PKD repeat protein
MGWPRRPVSRLTALPAVLCGVLAATAAAGPPSDYGDAPDGSPARYLSRPGVTGHFPSKLASDGAHHTAPGLLRLGNAFDLERDSPQVNRDTDDDGFAAKLKPCHKSTLSFVVNALDLPAPMRAAGHTAYLNAWVDWNRDGRWRGASRCAGKRIREWRLQNHPIEMASFASQPVQIIRVPVVAGPEVLDVWIRASLTLDQKFTSPLGKGTFDNGETEDYLYHAPQPPGTHKKKRKGHLVDEPPHHLIPFCLGGGLDFLAHGATTTISIFFWDPDIGWFAAPQPGTKSAVLNGLEPGLAPALPGDVSVQSFFFGAKVTSLIKDDRANPFEFVPLVFRVQGPHIHPLDQILQCPVVIVHSTHPGGGPGATPQPPGGGPVPVAGQPPVANFSFLPNNPPAGPKTGQTVTFDGSASSDPDGTIVSYDWDFGNGAHGTGQFPGTQYLSAGIYTVTLTVTDNDGNTRSSTQSVYVSGHGSKPAVLDDVPCDASGGYVDINIPSYAQNPAATLTSALTGCSGVSITNVQVTFVQGPVAPENGGSTTDEWGLPKNHLHITFDLTGSTGAAGPGSATFTATWQ